MYKISCWKWHIHKRSQSFGSYKNQMGNFKPRWQVFYAVMKEHLLLSWQQRKATQDTVTVRRKKEYCISYIRKWNSQNSDLEKPYMGWLVQSGAENTSYTKASWKCWGFFLFWYNGPFKCLSLNLNVSGAQLFGFVECLTLTEIID